MNSTPTHIETTVRTVVSKHSQYEDSDLDQTARLQEDLGIDSIMLAAIVGDLNRLLSTQVEIEIDDSDTLGSIVDRFARAGGAFNKPGPEPGAVAATDLPRPLDQRSSRTLRDFVASGSDADLFAKTRRFALFQRERTAAGDFWYGMASRGRSSSRAVIHDEVEGRDREFLLFASNNYLGLANDERVIEAICQAARSYGATNTGSRIIAGTTELHLELERRLARLKGREDCIVFPSGYSANLGTISALTGPGDQAIGDLYNHMSIQDGCKLSGAARRLYPHNDMAALEALLARNDNAGGKLIVADGVFSMHGDIVRLPELLRIARRYQARVLIDDAHSTGVLGATGSGTTEHFDMKGLVDLEVGTLSKALAGQGGFVVGDADVIDYLRFYANSYVFAATIPAPVVAGLIRSLDILEAEPDRLQRLNSNASYLRTSLAGLGFDTEYSQSAIIPVRIGDEAAAMAMGRSVRRRGMYCQTVVFPGVAVGDARLRISVLEGHTREDLDSAIQILVDAALENRLLQSAEKAA